VILPPLVFPGLSHVNLSSAYNARAFYALFKYTVISIYLMLVRMHAAFKPTAMFHSNVLDPFCKLRRT
jgi:hypothetical protein